MNRWPTPDEAALRAYYGPPGESNLVQLELPYPMRLAWALPQTTRRARCHRLVADSLRTVLEAILQVVYNGDLAALQAARMDLFGGVYNLRRMRGNNSAWSTHAWGIAIDLDPDHNGLHTPWPGQATMPLAVIETFERHGWTSLARQMSRDAMHFQATSWPARR